MCPSGQSSLDLIDEKFVCLSAQFCFPPVVRTGHVTTSKHSRSRTSSISITTSIRKDDTFVNGQMMKPITDYLTVSATVRNVTFKDRLIQKDFSNHFYL